MVILIYSGPGLLNPVTIHGNSHRFWARAAEQQFLKESYRIQGQIMVIRGEFWPGRAHLVTSYGDSQQILAEAAPTGDESL